MRIYCVASSRDEALHILSYSLFPFHTFKGKGRTDFPPCTMVDSGAFAFQKNSDLTLKKLWAYAEKYYEFIEKTNYDVYIELDLYTHFPLKEIERIRGFLMGTKKYVMPVFHPFLGKEILKKLINDYPFIGYSGAGLRIASSISIFGPFLLSLKPIPKLHCLGWIGKELYLFPFYSADSLFWKTSRIYGVVYYRDNWRMTSVRNLKVAKTSSKASQIYQLALLKQFQEDVTRYWEGRGIVWD